MSHFYGQYHVAETPSSLLRLHFHNEAIALKEVDWEPKVGVLDQEDLIAQGIIVSSFIPGAPAGVDALGSCTANATTSALSNLLSESEFLSITGATGYTDVVNAEKWAIKFYHLCTDQTGDPSQEWPPTDCGSSGPYVVSELQTLKLAASDKIATGAQNIVSLLQTGGILEGGPFLNAWEDPPASGIVDGNGTASELQTQINQGVAGGHETFISGIVKLTLSSTGIVEPEKTLLKVRNSWSRAWGDSGSFLIHLSTLVALGSYFDFRQLVA